MKTHRLFKVVCLLPFLLLFSTTLSAQEVRVVDINGAIGPATSDYFIRALKDADADNVELVVMRLDTPGGLVSSLRDMVKEILASPVPVAIYVAPDGARAASAGTYLTYASHIAAMSPVTNIGSSTPVSIGGEGGGFPAPGGFDRPSDSDQEGDESRESKPSDPSAMDKKVVNDAVAYIRSLAELRGRNADWAELTVREAANLTASAALEMNVIEYIAKDLPDLLAQIDGKTISNVDGADVTLNTASATVVEVETDWRYEFLKVITDPNIAYLLLIIGINALLFEFYSPGLGAGGIVGVICLLLAAYALQMLPVSFAGLALLIVGFGLLVAEVFTPTYGVLGLGGVVAFLAGSLLLFDTDIEGFRVSLEIIIAFGLGTAALVFFVGRKAYQHWKRGPVSGVDAVIGERATVVENFETNGRVRVAGEIWSAVCETPLVKDDTVVVKSMDGLTLTVEKVA
ncbi:MAG: nodulation protein NfeD [Gammaproteobacteria bacterium]|nr:nodulation protein NfeD [Gammaproteobacteria bacterium]